MTTTMSPSVNGRPRRSLNETIGRLDEMLDGLGRAIPETIRDELRVNIGAAVADGVRAALVEIAANLDLPALLHRAHQFAPTPPAPVEIQRPGLFRRVMSRVGQAAAVTATAMAGRTRQLSRGLGMYLAKLRQLWQFRRPVGVALVIGGLAATVTLLAPNWVGGILSGITAAGSAVAVQMGLWLRRAFGLAVPALNE